MRNPNWTVLVLGLFSDPCLVLPHCPKLSSLSQAIFRRPLSGERHCWEVGSKSKCETRAFLHVHFHRVALGDVSGKGGSISHVGPVHGGSSFFQPLLMPPSPLVCPSSLGVEVTSCCCKSLIACLASQTFYHPMTNSLYCIMSVLNT